MFGSTKSLRIKIPLIQILDSVIQLVFYGDEVRINRMNKCLTYFSFFFRLILLAPLTFTATPCAQKRRYSVPEKQALRKHYVAAWEDVDGGKGVPCGPRTSACSRQTEQLSFLRKIFAFTIRKIIKERSSIRAFPLYHGRHGEASG